jgi:creatinine amidohydrolase
VHGVAGAWIGDLTWPEVAHRLREGALVVVPVGAAAKAHGAHLPLDTDRVIACALAQRVADALPVLIAPVIDVGWYPAFEGYPGSQSITAESFTSLLVQIIAKLIGDGARHVAVINTGVSTEAPLSLAAYQIRERTGVKIAIADIRNLGREAHGLLEQAGSGGHADEHETSLMLAIDPGKVHLERARAEPQAECEPTVFRRPVVFASDGEGADLSALGATGDPTLASAEKGRKILAAMSRDLVQGLRSVFPHMEGGN